MKLGIINYGGGNLQSVRNALRHTGTEADYVSTADDFAGLDALVFPGQGAFGDSMTALKRLDLVEPLKDWIAADRPFFGICIGYQLLFESSEEDSTVEGLGIFKGRVVRFTPQPDRKVPHMGWNRVKLTQPGSLGWDGAEQDPFFYFVHSYYPAPEDPSLTAGVTDYDGDFVCAIERGNLIATQFHPEKSQSAGLRLLANFVKKHEPAAAAVS
ncbi:MAG: imidazole glycerol phosphate synthase subunit HisH [Verrucomicrobiota bacterium]